MQPIENSMKLSTTGQFMPKVGLGTWKIPIKECDYVIKNAIDCGYRLIDCACDYGNESEIGNTLTTLFDNKVIQRSELFITSKLWCTYMERQHVKNACEKTLKDLQLNYLDLYLIHFPISLEYVDLSEKYPPGWVQDGESKCRYSKATIRETWEAMENLVDLGLVKNIGVANFNCSLLMDLLKYARIKPAVNQIEFHPYLTHLPLRKLCRNNEIQITAFHSFGGQSLIELGNSLAIETPALLNHSIVEKISKKHMKTNAQILLRWAIDNNVAVIPKSSQKKRLIENLDVLNFQLEFDDINELNNLNQNLHFNDPKDFADTPIWD